MGKWLRHSLTPCHYRHLRPVEVGPRIPLSPESVDSLMWRVDSICAVTWHAFETLWLCDVGSSFLLSRQTARLCRDECGLSRLSCALVCGRRYRRGYKVYKNAHKTERSQSNSTPYTHPYTQNLTNPFGFAHPLHPLYTQNPRPFTELRPGLRHVKSRQ